MKRQTLMLLGLAFSALASFARGEDALSNVALFHRCYSQLTQSYPPQDDPHLLAVKNGADPINACRQILDTARFTASNGTMIANISDARAKAVLHTMHKLHASFFTSREFPDNGNAFHRFTANIYDVETPAFYFDRALFKPSVEVKTVLTAADIPRAIRTVTNLQTGAAYGFPKASYIFTGAFELAEKGDLLGIDVIPQESVPYSFTTGSTVRTGSVNFGLNAGHGVIGSQPFVLLNVSERAAFSSDGAINMPRKWARAVFSDMLCRNLPVVTQADAASFKVTQLTPPPAPFRTQESCLQCHVSMDRVASTMRNFRYQNLGVNADQEYGGIYAAYLPANHGAYDTWSATALPTFVPPGLADAMTLPPKPAAPNPPYYNLTNPTGHFYMRNYLGNLVNFPVSNVADLNAKLADQPDFYMCVAKRYYNYFIGVDVDLNPLATGELSEVDRFHKNAVISLGNYLMNDASGKQDLRKLIIRILGLEQYRSSSFKTRRGNE